MNIDRYFFLDILNLQILHSYTYMYEFRNMTIQNKLLWCVYLYHSTMNAGLEDCYKLTHSSKANWHEDWQTQDIFNMVKFTELGHLYVQYQQFQNIKTNDVCICTTPPWILGLKIVRLQLTPPQHTGMKNFQDWQILFEDV